MEDNKIFISQVLLIYFDFKVCAKDKRAFYLPSIVICLGANKAQTTLGKKFKAIINLSQRDQNGLRILFLFSSTIAGISECIGIYD